MVRLDLPSGGPRFFLFPGPAETSQETGSDVAAWGAPGPAGEIMGMGISNGDFMGISWGFRGNFMAFMPLMYLEMMEMTMEMAMEMMENMGG